jgi:thioredoxin reductase (NADPH)
VLEGLAAQGSEVALIAADLRLSAWMAWSSSSERTRCTRGRPRCCWWPWISTTRSCRSASSPRCGVPPRWGGLTSGWPRAGPTRKSGSTPQVQEALTAWTIAHRPGHLVYRIVGEQWAPRSHHLRDALACNSVPFAFHAADSAAGQQLIEQFRIDVRRLPALVRHDGTVLQDPSFAEVAAAHGIQTRPSPEVHDLAIVGAGPAGLAAAVYGASEGLRTVVLEPHAIGGQAGASSLIRNYLGFPRGISGGGLAHRAWEQAVLFGAEFVFVQEAVRLSRRGEDHLVALADGSQAAARAVIVAAGATYRRLGIPALDRLLGAGVFYGAAGVEAPALAGEHVCVVGGANSAGQAALHLAKHAARVTLLVRGESLAATMSDYLITQLKATPKVAVRLRARVADGHGEARLEALTIEDARTGERERLPAAAVFIMIGAEPCTGWLRGTVELDDRGFIVTGRDIPPKAWPLTRAPLPFETSRPGAFATGDLRHGSVKRVAGAVGEGSVTVGSVHQYLTELQR